MKINRHNYEEFFLLYVDKELPDADCRELEAFVAANPDLGPELEILQQLKFEGNAHPFPHKDSLFRTSAVENGGITAENCEYYFLLYADNELDSQTRRSVEEFVQAHPDCEKEFKLLNAVRLEAETLRFPDKSILYRTTAQPARFIEFKWWRIAAAAVVILFGGLLWMNTRQPSSSEKETAQANISQNQMKQVQSQTKHAEAVNEPENTNLPGKELVKDGSRNNSGDIADLSSNPGLRSRDIPPALVKAQTQPREKLTKADIQPEPDAAKLIASTDPVRSNHLPVPNEALLEMKDANLNSREKDELIAKNNPIGSVIDQPDGQMGNDRVKNDFASEALLKAGDNRVSMASYNLDDEPKSMLRGVFRKASRFMGKITNPDFSKSPNRPNK